MRFFKIQSENDPVFQKILSLYNESFPENERKELRYLLKPNQSIGSIFALFENEEFIGFLCILDVFDLSHIIYLSIMQDKRNKGLGAKALTISVRLKKACASSWTSKPKRKRLMTIPFAERERNSI